MSTASRHLCRALFQTSRQSPFRRKTQRPQYLARSIYFRQLSSNPIRRFNPSNSTSAPRSPEKTPDPDEDYDRNVGGASSDLSDPDEFLVPKTPITPADLDPQARADYDTMSKDNQSRYLAMQNHYAAVMESASEEDFARIVAETDRELDREVEPLDFGAPRALQTKEIGFWADDEDDEIGQNEDADDDWDESDITSVAHSELELHREVREYTRVTAWDMPLLNQYAKQFEKPDKSSHPLTFRYTTYMGEVHPGARRVVVSFSPTDLGLPEKPLNKLLKLAGPRYNPDTNTIKMSTDKFETAAQNKRYLADLVNTMVKESQTGDTFEDVPLDLRHVKRKREVRFPPEWVVTGDRARQIEQGRTEEALRLQEGPSVSGRERVAEYVRAMGVKVGEKTQRL